MTILQIVAITGLMGVLACNNNEGDAGTQMDNAKAEVVTLSPPPALKRDTLVAVIGTISGLVVDDYPVTNKMLADKRGNGSPYKKQSGEVYSYDKVWLVNDTIKQVLVFDLYTDYHRMITYHFYSSDIPADLMDEMELYTWGGEFASKKQKRQAFGGFLNQAAAIDSFYFVSEKGFRLGEPRQKALDVYGNPDRTAMSNGVEKLEWGFIGDIVYDGKIDLKGKGLAKDSFGHQVVMYFREGKLIGQILHNEIP